MFPHHLRRKHAEPPEPERGPGPFGLLSRAISYLLILAAVTFTAVVLGPGLPARWNPMAPLDPTARPSLFTGMKLARATATPEACLAVLERIPDIRYARLADREASEACHIRGHTLLRGLSEASLSPVSTSCATALRLYMWERWDLQPFARRMLGSPVREIRHLASYSCRPVRGGAGEGDRMSAHATAQAIDISGVTLENGRRLDIASSWAGRDSGFWRAARGGACDWFPTVLSPDYNRLHADHFHLGAGGGPCR